MRLSARWKRIGHIDAPPMSLIVRLARRLSHTLEKVCNRPRRVLHRERAATPVGKIQEVDVGCIQWLARQPGRTLTEKAGNKQELRSVRRFENADTLENRVVKELVTRCITVGRRYLRENERFSGHERLRLVRRFASLCSQLLRETPIGQVRRVSGIPQPNYVLQYEPTYHSLWQAYVLLMRQQRQEEELWRWRQRAWAEMCRIGTMAALQALGQRSPASRSDFFFCDDQANGQFVDDRSHIGAWWIDGLQGRQVLHVLDNMSLQHPAISSSFIGLGEALPLCPDFVLACQPQTNHHTAMRYVLCWALAPDLAGNVSYRQIGEVLVRRLRQVSRHVRMDALVIVATESTDSLPDSVRDDSNRVTVAPLPRALWFGHENLVELIGSVTHG